MGSELNVSGWTANVQSFENTSAVTGIASLKAKYFKYHLKNTIISLSSR